MSDPTPWPVIWTAESPLRLAISVEANETINLDLGQGFRAEYCKRITVFASREAVLQVNSRTTPHITFTFPKEGYEYDVLDTWLGTRWNFPQPTIEHLFVTNYSEYAAIFQMDVDWKERARCTFLGDQIGG